jgi:hypothetical protein
MGQDNTVHQLIKQREDLQSEVDSKQKLINELEGQKTSL